MERIDGYDSWKLSSKYDDEPETIEKECQDCGKTYEGFYDDYNDCPHCNESEEENEE